MIVCGGVHQLCLTFLLFLAGILTLSTWCTTILHTYSQGGYQLVQFHCYELQLFRHRKVSGCSSSIDSVLHRCFMCIATSTPFQFVRISIHRIVHQLSILLHWRSGEYQDGLLRNHGKLSCKTFLQSFWIGCRTFLSHYLSFSGALLYDVWQVSWVSFYHSHWDCSAPIRTVWQISLFDPFLPTVTLSSILTIHVQLPIFRIRKLSSMYCSRSLMSANMTNIPPLYYQNGILPKFDSLICNHFCQF